MKNNLNGSPMNFKNDGHVPALFFVKSGVKATGLK